MSSRVSDGFTIIETTLFLAVSALLILTMIVGAGASLNVQRYRDSVTSFKSLIQQQYAGLSSVQNGRSDDKTCTAAAAPTSGTDGRGQSNCFLVGKYMRIDRGDIAIYSVLARQVSSSGTGSDVAKLRSNYALNVDTDAVERKQMEWGTQIAYPAAEPAPTPRTLGLFFVRSPDSGQVYTFADTSIPAPDSVSQATFTRMLVDGTGTPGRGEQTICVASTGLVTTGDMAVYIAPYAANASAVETRSNDMVSKALQC